MLVVQMLPRGRQRLAVIEALAPVMEAAALLVRPHTDLVVVCDRGDMVGVLTKNEIVGQLSRCSGSGCKVRVDGIMTRDVTYCRTDEVLLDVWSVMGKRGLQRVPVLDKARRPLGIIYARDALQALLTESENEDALLRDYISGVGYR